MNDTWALEFQTGAAPLQLEVTEAEATPERVRLAWASSVPGLSARLDRAVGDGPWEALTTLTADALGQLAYEDSDVTGGAFLRYRLGVVWDAEELLVGLASVTVPMRNLSLAIGNPALDVRFRLELPSAAAATLAVFDIRGRRVWSEEVGRLGPGKHDVTPNGVSWHSGVYFAELVQEWRRQRVRFVALR